MHVKHEEAVCCVAVVGCTNDQMNQQFVQITTV